MNALNAKKARLIRSYHPRLVTNPVHTPTTRRGEIRAILDKRVFIDCIIVGGYITRQVHRKVSYVEKNPKKKSGVTYCRRRGRPGSRAHLSAA